jgi:hypothetical protein
MRDTRDAVQHGGALFQGQPVSGAVAELLDSLDTADSACEFGAEQAAIGSVIGEPTHGRKPLINTRLGQAAGFQVHAGTGDHDAAKGKAGLRAIPLDKAIHGELLGATGCRRAEAIEHGSFRMVQITEPEHGTTAFR